MDQSQVLVQLRPPGDRAVSALAAAARRLAHHYAVTVGVDRGIDRRRQSVVEHRVDGAAGDIARSVGATLQLQPHYDEVEHEFRFATRLHVPWGWPDLPVWIGVAELTPSRSVVRLSLRSHRRWRYPMRYFHVAHAFVRRLLQS